MCATASHNGHECLSDAVNQEIMHDMHASIVLHVTGKVNYNGTACQSDISHHT